MKGRRSLCAGQSSMYGDRLRPVRTREVCTVESSACESCVAEIGVPEAGAWRNASAAEVGALEIGTPNRNLRRRREEAGTKQESVLQDRLTKIGAAEVRVREVGWEASATEVGVAEVSTARSALRMFRRKLKVAEVGVAQVRSDPRAPLSPGVPVLDSLAKDAEVLSVRHGDVWLLTGR